MGGGNAQKSAMARQRNAAAAAAEGQGGGGTAGMAARGGDTAKKIADSQAAKTEKLAKQAEDQAKKAADKAAADEAAVVAATSGNLRVMHRRVWRAERGPRSAFWNAPMRKGPIPTALRCARRKVEGIYEGGATFTEFF